MKSKVLDRFKSLNVLVKVKVIAIIAISSVLLAGFLIYRLLIFNSDKVLPSKIKMYEFNSLSDVRSRVESHSSSVDEVYLGEEYMAIKSENKSLLTGEGDSIIYKWDDSLSKLSQMNIEDLEHGTNKNFTDTGEINLNVRASRLFSGPSQYPPEEFAAYAILAFDALPTSKNRQRYLMICEAFLSVIPHSSQLLSSYSVPFSEQLVTVWPIDEDYKAATLNSSWPLGSKGISDTCIYAVDAYGHITALSALNDAEIAGKEFIGIGPFLIAWSPSSDKGKQDAIILSANLSDVTNQDQAVTIFQQWRIDIESDPSIWAEGWNLEDLRKKIRHWVDKYGPQILSVFIGDKE